MKSFDRSWFVPLGFATSLALASGAHSGAHAGPVSISLGAGFTGQYTYDTQHLSYGSYPSAFPETWLGSLAVSYRFKNWLALRAETGYVPFEKDVGIVIPLLRTPELTGIPMERARLRATFVPIGTGVRFESQRPPSKIRLYVDAMPMIAWARFESAVLKLFPAPQTVPPVEYHLSPVTKTLWLPGVSLGAGLRGPLAGRLGYEFGAHFVATADPGADALRRLFEAQDPQGLRQLAVRMSLSFAP